MESFPFQVPEIVSQAGRHLSVRAAEKGLAWNVNVAPDLPVQVVGDPARLHQILVNLLDNAVKFTRAGRSLARCFHPGLSSRYLHVAVRGQRHGNWRSEGEAIVYIRDLFPGRQLVYSSVRRHGFRACSLHQVGAPYARPPFGGEL